MYKRQDIYNDIESDLASEEMFKKEIASKVEVKDFEIEKDIDKKQTEYQIRWLYSNDQATIGKYFKLINTETNFDSLFNSQLNDSVFIDDRQLKTSLYNIYVKNPAFAQIIDTLKPGVTSNPIHALSLIHICRLGNWWS